MNTENTPTIILVPGYWLGGWAWDDVVAHLASTGLTALPITLPGLESAATKRGGIHLGDHVDAVANAVKAAPGQVCLVAHSGAGALASAVLDHLSESINHVIYVESGPVANGTVARPDLAQDVGEVDLPSWAELEAGGASVAGLNQDMLRHFQTRALPHPAGPLREPVRLGNPARNQVPATIVCCSAPSAIVQQMATGGVAMFAPLLDMENVTYIDLPTGHWPMWSEPAALADVIAQSVSWDC